jgi:putative transposase
MSYTRIIVHAVWATKYRNKVIHERIRPMLFKHVYDYAHSKRIRLISINGHADHVHILCALKSTQNISEVVKLIKGESSHWLNERHLMFHRFSWQRQYYAVSVSPDHVHRVAMYIKNHSNGTPMPDFKQEQTIDHIVFEGAKSGDSSADVS